MEKYIIQIEKFLSGQMTQKEEFTFKTSLITDVRLRLYAFIITNMLREQKSW